MFHRSMAGALLATVLAGVLAAGGAARAHDGHDHGVRKVTGTVKAVHAADGHVEIRTRDGKTEGFHVDGRTKYRRGAKAASLADLAPGTRVVVTTRGEGERTIATEVRVGAAPSATPGSARPK